MRKYFQYKYAYLYMHKGVKISSHLFTKLESVAAAIKFEIKIK